MCSRLRKLTLAQLFSAAQILVTGAWDPDTRAHGVEELDPEDLRRGMLSEALMARLNRRA